MADFEALTHAWVTRAIRAEMVKNGITFGELAHLISALGGDENERNLRNKIARGTFSAALFVQCLAAMGSKTLTIDLLDRHYEGPRHTVPEYLPPSEEAEPRRWYGSDEERESIARAVWTSMQLDPSAALNDVGMVAVRAAVKKTDLRPLFRGAVSLDEMVQAIRKKLATS